jgi:hypothetical protein
MTRASLLHLSAHRRARTQVAAAAVVTQQPVGRVGTNLLSSTQHTIFTTTTHGSLDPAAIGDDDRLT